MSQSSHTNALINETSPYLLQHAGNPVNWLPWGKDALEQAVRENKLIVISIGYSACHWCHVMEHESFEDEEVAALMNASFVCIKIDREERPDIDQVYMDALQLMTGQGGWPLNCICLPDQRPIYGGTYFRKNDWMALLDNLAEFWKNSPAEAIEYASKLTEGIQESGLFSAATGTVSDSGVVQYAEILKKIDGIWMRHIDKVRGGFGNSPKFPLPNSWVYLMRRAWATENEDLMQQVDLTLHKMAYGGIYDQLGGGFSRYATDGDWMIPHFEKMLYDNAQLVSLYAEAWQRNGLELYRQVVYESLKFINRELGATDGGFYSALDADSEGIEGKYYTWSSAEINSLLGSDAEMVKSVFQVKEGGNWEHTNILHRNGNERTLAAKSGLTDHEFDVLMRRCKSRLMIHRSARIRPGLDDKMLASWNALMVKGYADAARIFGDPEFLRLARLNLVFILDNFSVGEQLYRTWKAGAAKIPAFLDDYVFLAEACTAMYRADSDERWIYEAERLMNRVIRDFYDSETGMFYYTTGASLIARKQEVFDTVIPSSSSVAGRVLLFLGTILGKDELISISSRMLLAVREQLVSYAPSFSNWSLLMQEMAEGFTEIAVCGPDAMALAAGLNSSYLPFSIIMTESRFGNSLPLLEGKTGKLINQIYICRNRSCLLPVTTLEEAMKLIISN